MIRIRNIKVDVKTNNLREMISKKIKTDNFTIQKILHKSIDARNKSNVFYVYDVLINTNEKIRFNEDILEPNFINNEIKVTVIKTYYNYWFWSGRYVCFIHFIFTWL